MKTRVVSISLGLLIALAWLTLAIPALAQGSIDVDLGTIGLATMQQMSPSRVFRPIDMIGAREGAEGWGMGGAHVAHVAGVEAIPWNPAGLGWLHGSDFTGNLRLLSSSGSTSSFPDSFSIPRVPRLSVRKYAVNLKSMTRYGTLGAATSANVAGRRLVGALSYRRYVDVAYPETIIEDLVQTDVATYPVTFAFDNDEKGGVDAAAASVGFEAVPNLLSLGANVNILMGMLRSVEQMIVSVGGPTNSVGETRSGFNYRGHSFDLGAQVRYEDLGSLGLRFTPGYTLQVRSGTFSLREIPTPGATNSYYYHANIAPYDLDIPSLLSVGGWAHVLPKVNMALEWNRQSWAGTKAKYVQGQTADPLPLRDVTSVHLGIEGRFLRLGRVDLPVRLGYHSGPLSMAPIQASGTGIGTRVTAADSDISTKAYTIGLGFETGNLRYGFSYEIQDYKLQKFYFDVPYDPFLNKYSTLVDVDRRVTAIRISATLAL
jgi:hypothetical protein